MFNAEYTNEYNDSSNRVYSDADIQKCIDPTLPAPFQARSDVVYGYVLQVGNTGVIGLGSCLVDEDIPLTTKTARELAAWLLKAANSLDHKDEN